MKQFKNITVLVVLLFLSFLSFITPTQASNNERITGSMTKKRIHK